MFFLVFAFSFFFLVAKNHTCIYSLDQYLHTGTKIVYILNLRRSPKVFNLSWVRYKFGEGITFCHNPCQTTKLRMSELLFEKQSPIFDVTLAFMLFAYFTLHGQLNRFVTIKDVGSIVWKFAKKMPSFNFKTSS